LNNKNEKKLNQIKQNNANIITIITKIQHNYF